MKVRAIARHGNKLGEKYRKAVGDEYEASEAVANGLIAQRLVEEVKAEEPKQPKIAKPKD